MRCRSRHCSQDLGTCRFFSKNQCTFDTVRTKDLRQALHEFSSKEADVTSGSFLGVLRRVVDCHAGRSSSPKMASELAAGFLSSYSGFRMLQRFLCSKRTVL